MKLAKKAKIKRHDYGDCEPVEADASTKRVRFVFGAIFGFFFGVLGYFKIAMLYAEMKTALTAGILVSLLFGIGAAAGGNKFWRGEFWHWWKWWI